jgi:hypothetical protein
MRDRSGEFQAVNRFAQPPGGRDEFAAYV